MTRKLDSRGRPVFDESTLLITVTGHEDVAATVYGNGNGSGRGSRGLDAIKAYVQGKGSKASFRSMFQPTDRTIRLHERMAVDVVDPAARADRKPRYCLTLDCPEDAPRVEKELEGDDSVVVGGHPVIQYPVMPEEDLNDETDGLWGLKRCRFARVRDALDPADEAAPPIALIDQGRDNGHPLLAGRIEQILPTSGSGSGVDHASQVASVICANAGTASGRPMSGACSANVELYDAWTSASTFDSSLYYAALRDIIAKRTPVVNISLASEERDPMVEQLITEAAAQGIVVVAAVGNEALRGNPKLFPAAHDSVIGVGGTDFNDNRFPTSCFGDHVFISAPGERILAVHGSIDTRRQTGTSLATPFIAAAVWLVKRKHPEWTVKEVKEALQRTADRKKIKGHARRNDEVGCGRLDVEKLAQVL